LVKKAIEKGIITTNQVASMSEKEIFNLIFAPGFSTAASVTNVSGRGVGMDVVRTNVERIGGTVELESVTGKGTSIKLKIPLTLAIVPALIVKSCGETFAIPQVKLEELVRVDNNSETNKLEHLHGVPVYRLRGQILPLVNINKVLGLPEKQDTQNSAINIAVLNADKCSFGLIVDEILDTADIVVKPINRLLKTLQVYSGATILGDGSIALILDVVGISKVAQIAGDKTLDKSSEFLGTSQGAARNQEFQDFLMVRLNSPTKHAIALNNVHRLEEFSSSKIEFAKKMRVIRYGQSQLPIISVNSLLGYESNTSAPRETVSVVVVEKAGRLFGLEVDEIVDTISTELEVDSSLAKQDGTFGNLSLADELVVVIDAFGVISLAFPENSVSPVVKTGHHLLSHEKSGGAGLSILIVEDTVFFRREISRILIGAGHEVVVATDGHQALQILEKDPQKFDLIVSDIEMPKMNGFELAKAVRSNQILKSLPMVAISSRADKKYSNLGMEAGFDIYIEKLKTDTLLGAVASLSSPRRAA
jgi:two-component system, chemotaxis family, sensor kinase CheA